MLPRLDLDEATRLALPMAEPNGEAQHRFLYRSETGEESWILARLDVRIRVNDEQRIYNVVVRPEKANPDCVCVCRFNDYECPVGKIPGFITSANASTFNWDAFAHLFNRPTGKFVLERYWLGGEPTEPYKEHHLFRLESSGEGRWLGLRRLDDEVTFYWSRANRFLSSQRRHWQFIHLAKSDFNQVMISQWQDENSEMRRVTRWEQLSWEEREEEAFACQNGSWDELKGIARWVLLVRVGHSLQLPASGCTWFFLEYDPIRVECEDATFRLGEDAFLSKWCAALLQNYSPTYIDRVNQPDFICFHIEASARQRISIDTPTRHEVLEAQQQLSEWAHAHFPADEARHLLEP